MRSRRPISGSEGRRRAAPNCRAGERRSNSRRNEVASPNLWIRSLTKSGCRRNNLPRSKGGMKKTAGEMRSRRPISGSEGRRRAAPNCRAGERRSNSRRNEVASPNLWIRSLTKSGCRRNNLPRSKGGMKKTAGEMRSRRPISGSEGRRRAAPNCRAGERRSNSRRNEVASPNLWIRGSAQGSSQLQGRRKEVKQQAK